MHLYGDKARWALAPPETRRECPNRLQGGTPRTRALHLLIELVRYDVGTGRGHFWESHYPSSESETSFAVSLPAEHRQLG